MSETVLKTSLPCGAVVSVAIPHSAFEHYLEIHVGSGRHFARTYDEENVNRHHETMGQFAGMPRLDSAKTGPIPPWHSDLDFHIRLDNLEALSTLLCKVVAERKKIARRIAKKDKEA